MVQLVIRVNEFSEKTDYGFQGWLDRGREWWKTRPGRAIEADRLVVIDASLKVMAVGKIHGVRKDIEQGSGRISVEVIPDPENEWIGKTIERGTSRNPIAYMKNIVVIPQE